MTPWFKNVKPHKDIQTGHLDESVFAANLAEVAAGTGLEIYTNPEIFFRKTYFTAGIKDISKRVVLGLNGGVDAENRVISLQTGFGGGKTHTLISLYHLAKQGAQTIHSEYAKELLSETGVPVFETAHIAVFTNTTNDPAQGRKINTDLTIRTLWGELAYQLGGLDAYAIIRENDEKRIAPKGLFKKVLERCKPALILIDELADYCVSASAVKVEASNLSDQTISFIQELTEATAGSDRCVLIATLPASAQELASSETSSKILSALENRINRVGANLKPVGDDEIFEVVRRRLFEDLGEQNTIERVIDEYCALYQSFFTEIPGYAVKTEYKEILRKAYPFHPELIDMFRLRWASNPFFQRTRGVLRILAAIVSDLWKRQQSLTGSNYLIHTSDVELANLDVITSQITSLFDVSWGSVITADVSGTSSNAFRIDNDNKEFKTHRVTQGVAATVLLGTFGSKGQNKGVSIEEIKLCMLKPEGFNHNFINGAINKLETIAHYLYYGSTGQRRYWFDKTPNVNILINQARSEITSQAITAEIIERAKQQTKKVDSFAVLINPSEDIPERKEVTLILMSPEYSVTGTEITGALYKTIERIASKKGLNERIYRNTILFLVCSDYGIAKAQTAVREYSACQKIEKEYYTQLEKEQKADIAKRITEAGSQADHAIASAYSIAVKYRAKVGCETLALKQFKDTLEEQINKNLKQTLQDEEWMLSAVGINLLQRIGLFPEQDKPVNVKEIYEAFLRFDDKPMILNRQTIQESLLKYCYNGECCIAAGNGKEFHRTFYKEAVPGFDVTDANYWLADMSCTPKPNDPPIITPPVPTGSIAGGGTGTKPQVIPPAQSTKIKTITVTGKVGSENYTDLFSSFIHPFGKTGCKIEIEIKYVIKAQAGTPIDSSSKEYTNAQESAKQLGLEFESES